MPGIIQNAQESSQALGQESASPPNQGREQGESATPQEQEGKDQIVGAAAKMLYDEKVTQKVVDNLKASEEDPSKAIASITEGLILQIGQKSEGSMPVELILPAADEILELVGEIGQQAGLFTYDEAMHARSAQKVIESIAPKYGATPEEIQAFMDSAGPDAQQMAVQHEGLVGGGQPAQEV